MASSASSAVASSAASVVASSASSAAASAVAKLAAARTAAKASALYARIAQLEYEVLCEAYTIADNQHRTLRREYVKLQKEYLLSCKEKYPDVVRERLMREYVACGAHKTAAHIASSAAMFAREQARKAVVEARTQKTLFEDETRRKAHIASLPHLRPSGTTV